MLGAFPEDRVLIRSGKNTDFFAEKEDGPKDIRGLREGISKTQGLRLFQDVLSTPVLGIFMIGGFIARLNLHNV